MSDQVQIIGSYISPYVRKVLMFLHVKGIAYEIDPIIPFMGDDRFTRLSPVRRIPVLLDDKVTLADSSVICQYLEDRYPKPALYPADVADRAQARWLEEYADTRIGEVFIWRLFNQRVLNRFVWGERTDEAIVDRAIGEEIPGFSTISSRWRRRRVGCSATFRSPALRSPLFSVTRRSRATSSMRRGGRTSPRGSRGCSNTMASCKFARMKSFRAAHRSTGIATRCPLSVRRSCRKVTARRDRGGAY
jgi:hypothetical protein